MEAACLHDFWFGGPLDDADFVNARVAVWFNTDFDFDAELRARFGTLPARAAGPALGHWAETPRGLLTLVIALDQLPRNIHRGEPLAFAYDAQARAFAQAAFARGFDRELALIERVFLYMPFEHAEDPAAQEFCVAGYEGLRAAAPAEFRELMGKCVAAGEAHREVIRRFGRFPHRNAILGRESTAEELAWCENHHGWGQGPKVLARRPGRR